jgi:putative flippase GtrA
MSDAVTGFIGAALMIAFLLLIAVKLNELALWAAFVIGIVLMVWAYWTDALGPVLGRERRSD